MTLPDTPKAALENYINELRTLYYPWYETASEHNYRYFQAAQAISILAAVATAILAAIMTGEQFASWGRVSLIILSILGSLVPSLVAQTRLRELWALREQGRQKVQYLIETGTAQFASASTSSEYTKIHVWLVDEIATLEADQSRRFYEIIPKQISIGKPHPSPTERHKGNNPGEGNGD